MRLRVPHTWAVLFLLVALTVAATWFLPAGEYGRARVEGRDVVDPAVYRELPRQPAGLADLFLAFNHPFQIAGEFAHHRADFRTGPQSL